MFLTQLLKGTDMDIYIHINKRYDSIRDDIIKDQRIFISNNNVEISWGDDGILRAYLHMLGEIMNSGREYHYVLFNTGQDLLIREGLDDYLAGQKNKIFVYGYADDRERRAFIMHRWPEYYRKLMNFKLHPIKILRRLRLDFYRRFPFNEKKTEYNTSDIVFYYNDMWASYPFEVAEYIYKFWKATPSFFDIYKDALVPEEAFFLTIIMMSKYKSWVSFDETGKSNDLFCIRGINNGHPLVNTFDDVKELESSGQFFSRKFDIRVDKNVVEYFYNKITKEA